MKKDQRSEVDRTVDAMAEALVADLERLEETPEVAHPAGTVRVPRREQLEQYYAIRDSVPAWEKLIDERGPKAVIEYALAMGRMDNGKSDGK
jgi:hypothetical protein